MRFLVSWQCGQSRFYECMVELSREMAKKGFWEAQEVDGIQNWISDLTAAGYAEPVIVNDQVGVK